MKLPTALNPSSNADRSPADPETAIWLQHVSVRYRVPRERISTFKEYAIRLMTGQLSQVDHLALNDVDMTMRRGEVLGVIGRNGAGKSTLLKLVARVLQPTAGRVWVKGRVAPLLDVSSGFHPELTGRENVYLNGTLLGLTRQEIAAHFDSIVEFAELWDFIEAPLRMYSSGMIARLGFAVATAVEPDVLLVDEVLAVGDGKFRAKCAERMQGFRDHGTTILLVSHDMNTVRQLCERAAWLEQGQIMHLGPASEVVAQYSRA